MFLIPHLYQSSSFINITAMAAAALSRSRGATGGLFFMFTLLCLVCQTLSWIDNDKLNNLKEGVWKIEQEIENVKAQRDSTSELLREYTSVIDPMMAFWEKISEETDDNFPSMDEILKSNKGFVEKIKTYQEGQNEELDAKIADVELKLGKMKTLVKALEEYQAEL